MFYKLVEASLAQDLATTGQPQPNNAQQPQVKPTETMPMNNNVQNLNLLKQKGIDTSNPIIIQVASKLNLQEVGNIANQLIASANDAKQIPEILTTLLSLSTQLKNFNQLPVILKTLSKADTM